MSQATLARPSLTARYEEAFPNSRKLFEQAKGVFPNGVTHDLRHLEPFPIYVERANGSTKWDVDGNELLDHWMGHGSLLLGHNHPQVTAAVAEQVHLGTHYPPRERFGSAPPIDAAWLDDADLAVVETVYAGRVTRSIVAEGFKMGSPSAAP